MARPALAATRALEILDWFASHPGDAFTLSELSRALDINASSTLSVLKSLTDGAYLVRHPSRKTYEAGPALVALRVAATPKYRAIELLDGEIKELANELETECVATINVADQIVAIATAGRPRTHGLDMRVGQRMPLVAPVGQVFVAWAAGPEVEAWFRRGGIGAKHPNREYLEEALAVVRARGYSLSFYRNISPASAPQTRLAERPHDSEARTALTAAVVNFDDDHDLLDPKPRRTYHISGLAAPVFGVRGEVEMSISLNGFTQISGREILANAERLLQTTRLLTKYGDGRFPDERSSSGRRP
jgi:DNA-binding IclR family transcriptional regulator